MKSKLALAALIAATLALGACSNAPHSGGATAFNPADPTSGPYPAKPGNIGLIATTVASGSVHATEFRIPAMVADQPTLALGVKKAGAFFHATRDGVLKITAKEGKPYVHVLPSAHWPDIEHDLALGRSPADGIPLRAGWYGVDIQCLSEHCVDVTVTFDDKPIVPFAQPPNIYAMLQ